MNSTNSISKGTIKKLIFPLILLAVLLLCSFIYPFSNKLTIQTIYAAPMNGTRSFAYWDTTGNGLSNEGSTQIGFTKANIKSAEVADFGATLILKHDTDDFKQLALQPTDLTEVCGISSIKFSVNDNDILFIPSNEIDLYFQAVDAVGSYDESQGVYFFAPLTNNAILLMSLETYQSITADAFYNSNFSTMLSRIAGTLLFTFLLSLLILKWNSLLKCISRLFEDEGDKFSTVAIGLFIIVTLSVCVIAFKSELGVHPDEYDVVECLKYGMKHFFPPDVRDAKVADTFSGYGYTKLQNSTYYFFLAGKVALVAKALFAQINWYRIPNVLLFLGMGIIYLKNIRKNNWLVLALGTSVQAWYIFSYTTADALDFFWSFLVLLQLADDGSWLNITLKEICEKKHFNRSLISKSLLLGILFGMVFLGKQNYWIMLLLTFVVLLSKILQADKNQRKQYWKIYVLILGMFIITVGTRFAFDFAHYGTQGNQIKAELDAQYADYDKNPTTASVDLCASYKMKDQGYALNDLFVESPNWFKYSFHSFCGLVTDQETSEVYYAIMGFLYVAMLILLAGEAFSSNETLVNETSPQNKQKKIEFIVCASILALNVLISILNSYISDIQSQGRYLLPVAFVLAYMGSRNTTIWEKKYFKYLLLLTNILCVWYFASKAPGLLGINPWK